MDDDSDRDEPAQEPDPDIEREVAAGRAISPALQRLIEEVRTQEDAPPGGYDRVYHRHNR